MPRNSLLYFCCYDYWEVGGGGVVGHVKILGFIGLPYTIELSEVKRVKEVTPLKASEFQNEA